MYILLGNTAVDSKEMKIKLEENTEFKVIKDMCKGTKREDVLAYTLSVKIDILNEIMEEDYELNKLNEDELFEEYLTLSEEIATDLEEYMPEGSILDIRAYKWDTSDNDIKLIMVVANEEFSELKLKDVMKKLIKQAE